MQCNNGQVYAYAGYHSGLGNGTPQSDPEITLLMAVAALPVTALLYYVLAYLLTRTGITTVAAPIVPGAIIVWQSDNALHPTCSVFLKVAKSA